MADRWLLIETFGGEGHEEPSRLTHCDPETGERRYSEPFAYPADRLASTDWAYCETVHSSQGWTVAVSIALITGSETRQWLNTAMTPWRTRQPRDRRIPGANCPHCRAPASTSARPSPAPTRRPPATRRSLRGRSPRATGTTLTHRPSVDRQWRFSPSVWPGGRRRPAMGRCRGCVCMRPRRRSLV